MTPHPRPPLTDSPWFWVYLFCTAGLLALLLQSGKYGARQSQLDRQFQGRELAKQLPSGEEVDYPFSTTEDKVDSLRPLYWILSGALAVGWVVLWWQRFRPSVPPNIPPSDRPNEATSRP